jgi:hypothetical protein
MATPRRTRCQPSPRQGPRTRSNRQPQQDSDFLESLGAPSEARAGSALDCRLDDAELACHVAVVCCRSDPLGRLRSRGGNAMRNITARIPACQRERSASPGCHARGVPARNDTCAHSRRPAVTAAGRNLCLPDRQLRLRSRGAVASCGERPNVGVAQGRPPSAFTWYGYRRLG